MATPLQFKLLGDFAVLRAGAPVSLPASRKTRSLLAYLVVTARPQRRERLCELFWDAPDDPRAALRWSLSRLRAVVNDEDCRRLAADRERAQFSMECAESDLGALRAHIDDANASVNSLIKALSLMMDEFLGGVDLPDQREFTTWLAAERGRIERLRAATVKRLIEHRDAPPDLALEYSEKWIELQPYSRDAANAMVKSLRRLGRDADAAHFARETGGKFAEAGLDWKPESPRTAEPPNKADAERVFLTRQSIQFCKTKDGVTIAYGCVGDGPPLVKAANWLSHLELDWNAPIWSPLFRELATGFRFIRYDERGNGLSDWAVPDISMDAFVADLETVVDALGLERFPLLGISQGAAVSIEYARRHPERVSKLILFGGYPRGWRIGANAATIAEREAVITLTRTGWGQDNPAYRHIFSATFMPGATAEQLAWFDDFQRRTTSPENAARFLSAFGDIDVADRLAGVKAPTLVLHSRGDRRIPWETGRDLAASIPDARLVTLESDNHLLLEGEPAAAHFVDAVRTFLAE
ncbi:MAG: alpha/beta fold hydrolase [Parvularculaceae bacterium]